MNINFETNNKNIKLNIEISKNDIIKEYYIYTKNIRMFTFSKLNYKGIKNKINSNNCLIYFLINEYENSIYIGKSKDILNRLKYHEQDKIFTKIILFNNDEGNQVVIDYLEYGFIEFFKNNDIFKFDNLKNESEPKHNHLDKQLIDESLNTLKGLLVAENIRIDKNNINNSENNIQKSNFNVNINSKQNLNKKISREYYLSENFDPTNSSPKYIKIFGDKIEINSGNRIGKYVAEQLYFNNKKKFIQLAYNKGPSKQQINISDKKDYDTKNYELVDNQIYISTNLSALTSLKMTKLILEQFNVELDDISIYVEGND